MDLNFLKILNPWWQDRGAIEQDSHLVPLVGKPYYFDNPVKKKILLKKAQTYILRGARQVGKTTLLKEKIAAAISGQVPATNILFLSCEACKDFGVLREILSQWIAPKKNQFLVICLDEITFVGEWQRSLLWLVNAGLLKNAVTLITGSDARDLQKSSERFPGRHVAEVQVHPLSLADYKSLACFKDHDRQKLLEIYLLIGGFPHAVRDYCEYGFITDETYETYANWILGDAHRYQMSRELLTHIMYRIYETAGSQVTWQRLIEKSPVRSHETASAYVEHLGLAFVCKVLACYDPDHEMGAPRKAKKIYFADPLLYGIAGGYFSGLRNVFQWWKEKLNDRMLKGTIFESVVANQIARSHDPVYYWYSSNLKREVDFLIKKGKRISLYEAKLAHQEIRPVLGEKVKIITPEIFTQNTFLHHDS